MSYVLYFEIKKLPPSLNGMLRGSWRAKHGRTSEWKSIVARELLSKKLPPSPLKKFSIIFTRHTTMPLDVDNLAGSFKPVMDSLKERGVIEDDRWSMTDSVSFSQVRVKTRKEHKISVLVTGVA